MWYEKYEKLNSVLFTYENSGKRLGFPPPYRNRMDYDLNTIDIYGEHGMEQLWHIIGYSEQLPFYPDYPAVGIMFEDNDFEKVWWHYMKE
jgi:hypothetical protein